MASAQNYQSAPNTATPYLEATKALKLPKGDTANWQYTTKDSVGSIMYVPSLNKLAIKGATRSHLVIPGEDLYTKGDLLTAGNALVNFNNISNLGGNLLLGRYSNSSGTAEEISVGSGLTLNATTGVLTGLSLNGQTGATQVFGTGTSGNNFSINSNSNTHTFNLPDASATARGVVTTGFQTFAGSKVFSSNITINSIPNMASAAGQYLVSNSGVVNHRTPSQVLSDISAAPATGSTNYIWNGSSPQTAGFWVTGIGLSNAGFEVWKNGSAFLSPHYNLKDAAGAQRAAIQLNNDAIPGLGFWVNNQERMLLTSDGKLRVNGTGAPAHELTVFGVASANSVLSNEFGSGSTGGNSAISVIGGWTNNYRGGSIDFYGGDEGTSNAGELIFRSGTAAAGTPSERMRVESDGNIRIGTSASSTLYHLHVHGSGGAGNAIAVQNSSGINSTSGGRFISINTTDPSAADQRLGSVESASYNAGAPITGTAIETFSGAAWSGGNTPAYMKISTVSTGSSSLTEKMRITADGNVGIGSPAPTSKLDINGYSILGAAGSERLSLRFNAIGFNRDVTNGNIFSSTGHAYQISHTASTTAASDIMQIGVWNPSGGAVNTSAFSINGAGNVSIGTALQVSGTATVQKIIATTPTAYDITHNNQSIAKDATTNELVPYDGAIADYVTLSGNTTLNTAEVYIKSNSTAYTVTVPSASANPGRVYVIKNSAGTTNDITLNVTTNSQTIDGANTNFVMTPGVWIRIISNGTAWFKIGG